MITAIANSLRNHRDLREANPRLSGLQIAGIAAAGVGIGTLTYYLFRPRPPIGIDTAFNTPSGPAAPPRGSAERPSDPPPAPTSTAHLPAIILAGGVPLEPGWTTVSWYRYPPSSAQPMWIRIDQFGIPSIATDTCFAGACESGIAESEGIGHSWHGHVGLITGKWRWTVIAGEATPLATELIDGTYSFVRAFIYPRYDREALENAMIDYVASDAADWMDLAYGL